MAAPDRASLHLGHCDSWAQARKTIEDIRRVAAIPEEFRKPDGTVNHPDFSGHKGIYLANLEGFLGGRFPALLAERDRYVELLRIAREAIEYALDDHHLDGDECLCEAARSTLAAGLSLTEEPRHA